MRRASSTLIADLGAERCGKDARGAKAGTYNSGDGTNVKRTIGLIIAGFMLVAGFLAVTGLPFAESSSSGVASAATPAQQIGLKVLVINDNSDGGYAAGDWVNTLKREGVPYDEVNTNPTSLGSVALPTLSTTAADGTQVANYEGVVVAVSGTSGLSPAQWTTLQTFEHDFSVRQVTAYAVPSSDTGTTYLGKTFSSGAVSATNDAIPTPTLTTAFSSFFPYLKKVDLDPTTFGYEGTAGASDQTLLSGPNSSSLLGIYKSTDGRETMYQTFSENQYEVQSELLRHGELAWLTRDTYLGDQRNYLETNIDDNFLADDVWSVAGNATTAPHSTDFVPTDAIRETAPDVAYAAQWSKSNNFRIDMLFNGGGSVQFAEGCQEASAGDGGAGGTATGCTGAGTGSDPLLSAFQANDPATGKPYTADFSWVNHTWDHPNLDQGCATTNYIEAEINQNTNWGSKAAASGNPTTGGLGLTQSTSTVLGAENPSTVVTGEHSGLANLIPGNPGQVDPPSFNDQGTNGTTGGTLAAGQYVYAVADQFNTAAPGATPVPAAPVAPNTTEESAASVSSPVTVTAGQTVPLSWEAVCKAADYIVYRAPYTPPVAPATVGSIGTYTPIGVVDANTSTDFINPTSTSDTTNGGPINKTLTDTGSEAAPTLPAGASTTPLLDGTAIESAYEQNPNLDAAFAGTLSGGIKYFGADASKPYPSPADGSFATGSAPASQYAATAAFPDAGATGIPRYPTNIYYNVSTNAEEVDEYNTLYLPTGDGTGACAAPRTDCSPAGTAPYTITQIVASVDQGMFQHMMGNDPKPHYFHQSNLMSVAGQGDGLYYETMNPLITEYDGYFVTNSATAQNNAPIEQLTTAQIGDLLNEQSAWAAGQTHVTGSINGNVVTITNTGAALQLPLTGMTDVGTGYAGTVSGWANAPAGTSTHTAITPWPALPTTPVVVTTPTGPAPGGTTKTTLPGPVKPPATPVGPVVPKKRVVSKPKPIVYDAVQVKPKTVSISKKGKVTVSLQCKATKGKTAKNKLCAGSFTLTIAGHKLGHRFRFRSPKTHRFTVALSTKVMAAVARTHRHHKHKMVGSLLIKTTQTHAKARQTRGTLTIRV
jgi:hypothetical protein